MWLVYPGFKPFPAAVGAFRYEVQTPHGTLMLCVLPSVAARQRRSAGQPLEGGLVLLTFDPSRTQQPRFPLDPVFETARKEGLLTARQLGALRALPEREHEEIEQLSLELNGVPTGTAARLVFGLLSAVEGLATSTSSS